MEKRARHLDILLGTLVLSVVGVFFWLSFVVSGNVPSDATRYTLLFDSALGLHEDNAVSIAGVQIGTVTDIGIEGRLAKVEVAVSPEVKLYPDAKAAVRAKSLLGEKYVDIDPGMGQGAPMPAGAVLKQNVPTVEIDNVIRSVSALVDSLNVITPPLEAGISRLDSLLRNADGEKVAVELGQTIADAGALIREANRLFESSADDLRVLLSMMRDKGPQLIDDFSATSKRMDELLAQFDPNVIKSAVNQVSPTFQNVEAASADLQIAMAEIRLASQRLEGVMRKVDTTLTRIDGIDETRIREFLQVEGVRVNLIPDAKVERKVRELRNESTPLPVP